MIHTRNSVLSVLPIVLALGCANEPTVTGTGHKSEAESSGGHGYLIRNASLVLTMDPSLGSGMLGAIENADVLIVNDEIADVGVDLPMQEGVQVIDAEGSIVMPGFVDTHDHFWQSVIRGCAADDDLNGWLGRCVFALNQPFGPPSPLRFSEDDAYAAVRLSTTGLINTGVTTGVDWSHAFNPDFVRGNLRALNDSGMRYHFAMFGANFDGSDIIAAKSQYIDPNPLGTLQVAAHPANDPFFLAPHLAAMTAVAENLGVKLHLHLLENIAQLSEQAFVVMDAQNTWRLHHDLYFAHAIHLDNAQIAKIALEGASVSHQPLSNMRLASGIMRYADIKNAGIDIGLGLDGGTNDFPDVFANMRAAVGLQRAKTLDKNASPTVAEVLRAATLGGAEVLDQDDIIGSLTPGKQADLFIMSMNELNFAPRLNVVNQIVFNGIADNVKWVFVAGNAVKKNGKIVGVNIKQLLDDAQVAADNIDQYVTE